jgi:membrane protein implicated in regulation of membrane protease activity
MSGWLWGAVGLCLAVLEVAIPGMFLIFPAIGALVAAIVSLAIPLELEAQLGLFAAASLGLWLASARAYRRLMRGTRLPLVNSPSRLIGSTGTVAEPIQQGRGKIRLGDTLWLACGPDLPAGTPVRVRRVEGTVLEVEPMG